MQEQQAPEYTIDGLWTSDLMMLKTVAVENVCWL